MTGGRKIMTGEALVPKNYDLKGKGGGTLFSLGSLYFITPVHHEPSQLKQHYLLPSI